MYNSPAGMVQSHWQRENGKTTLSVTVPPNCEATVYFPDVFNIKVKENSGFAKEIGKKDGYVLFEIPSGSYKFEN